MTISANDFLEQLEMSGFTALGPPESPVVETCAMMGAMEAEKIEQNFKVEQNNQKPDLGATPAMGFEFS